MSGLVTALVTASHLIDAGAPPYDRHLTTLPVNLQHLLHAKKDLHAAQERQRYLLPPLNILHPFPLSGGNIMPNSNLQ